MFLWVFHSYCGFNNVPGIVVVLNAVFFWSFIHFLWALIGLGTEQIAQELKTGQPVSSSKDNQATDARLSSSALIGYKTRFFVLSGVAFFVCINVTIRLLME